jgi:hypothetical protein
LLGNAVLEINQGVHKLAGGRFSIHVRYQALRMLQI